MPSAARSQTRQDRHQRRDEGSGRANVAQRATSPPAPSQRHSRPPDDGAEVLAEFPRRTPEGGPARLRVMISEFQDRPILHLRVWTGKTLLPSKAGVTVKVGEIDNLIRALQRAKAVMTGSIPDPPVARNYAPNEQSHSCNVALSARQLKPPLSQDDAARARSMAPWE